MPGKRQNACVRRSIAEIRPSSNLLTLTKKQVSATHDFLLATIWVIVVAALVKQELLPRVLVKSDRTFGDFIVETFVY